MSGFTKWLGKKSKKKDTPIIDTAQSTQSFPSPDTHNPKSPSPDHSSTQSLAVTQQAQIAPADEATAAAASTPSAEASTQVVSQAIDAPTADRTAIPILDAPVAILDITATVSPTNSTQGPPTHYSSMHIPAVEIFPPSSTPVFEPGRSASPTANAVQDTRPALLVSTSVHHVTEAPVTIGPPQTHLSPVPNHPSSLMNVESSTFSAKGDLMLSNYVTNIYNEKLAEISERQRKIADWLSPLNYPAIQKDTYEKVVRGTGQWLIHDPIFDDWISQETGTLWGTGIPGAGKTHLTSIVVHHLQGLVDAESSRTNNLAAVVYVYCRYNDELSTTQILASMLKQLVEDNEAAASRVEQTLYNPCTKKQTPYTLYELLASLQGALELFPKAFIVVDALDEIRQDDVRYDLVRTLLTLEQHLFLTSRDIPLEGILTPHFKIRAPSKDFQLFITRELKRFPKINSLLEKKPQVLVEITQAIESKSDGMFLLSALQLAALRGVTSIKSLRHAISQLPTTLADMYHLTLKRIKDQDEEEASLALRAILWVTHATCSMEIDELLMALSVDPEGIELDSEALTNESTLVSACLGLVTVEIENRTVRLVHFTAQNFFASHRTGIFEAPQAHIASVCAGYLQLSGYNWAGLGSNIDLDKFAGSRPFCAYACQNLGLHLAQILADPNTSEEIPQTVLHFFLGQPSLLLQVGNALHVGGAAHFACFHSLVPLVDQFFGDVNTFSTSGYTPLYYACRRGYTTMVAHLLSNFNIGVNDSVASGEQMTPLYVAAEEGDDSTVRLLLSTPGINVNAENGNKWTALHIASLQDYDSIVKLLLATPGINVNAENGEKLTALHVASDWGLDSIVNLLLATPGIDVNARGNNGETALFCASRDSHISVVQQLLNFPGIEINAQNENGWTALHIASFAGERQVAPLLLDFPGIEVNAKTTGDAAGELVGFTALDMAIKMGQQGIVMLFKERGYTNDDLDMDTISDTRPL